MHACRSQRCGVCTSAHSFATTPMSRCATPSSTARSHPANGSVTRSSSRGSGSAAPRSARPSFGWSAPASSSPSPASRRPSPRRPRVDHRVPAGGRLDARARRPARDSEPQPGRPGPASRRPTLDSRKPLSCRTSRPQSRGTTTSMASSSPAVRTPIIPEVLERVVPVLRRVERMRFASFGSRASVAQHRSSIEHAKAGDAEAAALASRRTWLSLRYIRGLTHRAQGVADTRANPSACLVSRAAARAQPRRARRPSRGPCPPGSDGCCPPVAFPESGDRG